jgi:hypothetical protein
MMEIGLIKWFRKSLGYGVLKTPENIEVFLHISDWIDTEEIIVTNQTPLIFKLKPSKKKLTAIDCCYFKIENKNHWDKLFSLSKFHYSVNVNNSQNNILNLVLNKFNSDFDFSTIEHFFIDIINKIEINELRNTDELIYVIYNKTPSKLIKNVILEIISSKVELYSNTEIINFWRDNIIPEFIPTNIVFEKSYKEIKITDLVKINEQEVVDKIIVLKAKNLRSEISLTEYLNFDKYLKFINTDNLKSKILNYLDIISNSEFINYAAQEISEITQNDKTNRYTINEYISKLPAFLTKTTLDKVKIILSENIQKNSSFITITQCWSVNIISKLNDKVIQDLQLQSKDDLLYFIGVEKCAEKHALIILDKFMEEKEFEIVLKLTKSMKSLIQYKYNKIIKESVTDEEYFEMWRLKKSVICPDDYILRNLNHAAEKYTEMKLWVRDEIISRKEAVKILSTNLNSVNIIETRYDFYKVFHSVKCITEIEPKNLVIFDSITNNSINSFVSLILWHLRQKDYLDFEILKGKFIYFNPDDQVYIFKRLFYLKHIGQINFDLNKLDEITRADINLYLENEKFCDDFILDISTHTVIECLKSFQEKENFKFESDLILKDLRRNSKQKFKIGKYFDYCKGRLTSKFNWHTEGTICEINYQPDKFYYAISFKIGEHVKARGYQGYYTYFEKNYNFDYFIEEVKKIPKAKWNAKENHWGVLSQYKDEVYSFARKNNFFIKLKNNKHYENNTHFAEFTRNIGFGKDSAEKLNIPNGIIFCEGRKANKLHSTFNKEFWWCSNQECLQNSIEDHLKDDYISNHNKEIWEDFTLLDMMKILHFKTDDYNYFDLIVDGHYYKLLGHINAFNRLLKHLYCDECNNLLYPVNISHFALYTDVRFHCIYENCSKKRIEIYLNKCLFGECEAIIDSRISNKCEYNMIICSNCGTCCSEEFFKRRLQSLQNVGGYIHDELIYNVENNNGHLEKKEYYCYKCQGMMTEINSLKYGCAKCDITYDLAKFKTLDKKWTQTHRRKNNYPKNSANENKI